MKKCEPKKKGKPTPLQYHHMSESMLKGSRKIFLYHPTQNSPKLLNTRLPKPPLTQNYIQSLLKYI